ncbi:acyl-CoA dehydrogenase family protein [Gordonia rubripertincta]|uniref:Acyl-CoA dehydrogenase family protein n=1 Tax=Gordonia rubripertincta TaxID=36822 RepID=A0ABT4MVM9_GORRU|nr:acyl-CoA dehydrogenase family protein [Gordonia rubripertincta]MCZ4551063.1 acyl-CoA dehydrogenase family protein [Gordonia rubripertincta]
MAAASINELDMTLYTRRLGFADDHHSFRESVRAFLRAEAVPHLEQWRSKRQVPIAFLQKAGHHGLLATTVPEAYGGGGSDDPRFLAVVIEEVASIGAVGLAHLISAHSAVTIPALMRCTNPDFRRRWIPPLATGQQLGVPLLDRPRSVDRHITKEALDADLYHSVSGGAIASVFISDHDDGVAVFRADGEEVRRVSGTTPVGGTESGQADVIVGVLNAHDVLSLDWSEIQRDTAFWSAVIAVASVRSILVQTVAYVGERQVFGKPLGQFDNTRRRLSELIASLQAAQLIIDNALEQLRNHQLEPTVVAAAHIEAARLHDRAVDVCLQLHGGYGYMREYPVSRAFADAAFLRSQERLLPDPIAVIADRDLSPAIG